MGYTANTITKAEMPPIAISRVNTIPVSYTHLDVYKRQPSGCGKSTTLRMIAGLEDITAGTISMNGAVMNEVPSGKRSVSMVFQNYALFPHMTVENNITYGLKAVSYTHLTGEGWLRRFDKRWNY